eukprot:CAMPEP_0197917858 /NCGR_PEP_ID=MMETSP1439-20131203/84472_1 /TAXON_ID=66791 /ORGANISM="Gonyaulax spinifera, Strain CCMP409" /LENGTH=61 /DNA_ID=CAMNT_0043539947 /DNA_START=19 /DNA_END=200 /DNA_ORIENTATION=+
MTRSAALADPCQASFGQGASQHSEQPAARRGTHRAASHQRVMLRKAANETTLVCSWASVLG